MYEIKDKNVNNIILAKFLTLNDVKDNRTDFNDAEDLLQIASIKQNAGKVFKPHTHLLTEKYCKGTQEAWIVITGEVVVSVYNLDGTFAESVTLQENEICIMLRGGHGYEITKDNTIVFEFKSGPYFGVKKDKIRF